MSVHRRPERGNRPEVRWKEGGRHRSRLFDKVRDAEAFDREIKRNRQLGTLASSVLQSRMTLTDFVRDEWWPKYVVPNLEESTRDVYAQIWAKHLLPRIGGYQLRELTPAMVEDLRAQMHAAHVGDPTQIKAPGSCKGSASEPWSADSPEQSRAAGRQAEADREVPAGSAAASRRRDDSRPARTSRRDPRLNPRLRGSPTRGGDSTKLG